MQVEAGRNTDNPSASKAAEEDTVTLVSCSPASVTEPTYYRHTPRDRSAVARRSGAPATDRHRATATITTDNNLYNKLPLPPGVIAPGREGRAGVLRT